MGTATPARILVQIGLDPEGGYPVAHNTAPLINVLAMSETDLLEATTFSSTETPGSRRCAILTYHRPIASPDSDSRNPAIFLKVFSVIETLSGFA